MSDGTKLIVAIITASIIVVIFVGIAIYGINAGWKTQSTEETKPNTSAGGFTKRNTDSHPFGSPLNPHSMWRRMGYFK